MLAYVLRLAHVFYDTSENVFRIHLIYYLTSSILQKRIHYITRAVLHFPWARQKKETLFPLEISDVTVARRKEYKLFYLKGYVAFRNSENHPVPTPFRTTERDGRVEQHLMSWGGRWRRGSCRRHTTHISVVCLCVLSSRTRTCFYANVWRQQQEQ